MYITRIDYGKRLDLMTIFTPGSAGTQELLDAIIEQNKNEIAAQFGESQTEVQPFRQHILDNTVFYDIKKQFVVDGVLISGSSSATQQVWVQWWTVDNRTWGVCNEDIIKLPDGDVDIDVIVNKLKESFPDLIKQTDGTFKQVHVSDYKIFKLQ
jgi:hypothetical protein